MIQHVYERVSALPLLSKIAVATDDQRIAESVRSFGGRVIMTSFDHPSGTDRLAEAAEILNIAADDVVINIQGDQPLFNTEVVEQLAVPLLNDPSLPMATLIYKIIRMEEISNPNHVKTVFDQQHNALYFSRAPIPFQQNPDELFPPTYYKHLGFYAYRNSFLRTFVKLPEGEWERFEKLEQLRVLEYGYKIRVILTSHDSVEVDTPDDLARVTQLLLSNTAEFHHKDIRFP